MLKDANLILRTSSNGVLDSDTTLSVVDLKGTPISGLALEVVVPAAVGETSDPATLDIYIRASSSSNPDSNEQIASSKQITAAGVYMIPFSTKKRYIEVFLNIGGTCTDFSYVEVGMVLPGRGVDRSKNW